MAHGGLEGLAILVTGGGTGIGKACAARLAADGAAVTICGRTEASLQAAADEIAAGADHGGSIQLVCGDVTNEAEVQAIVEYASQVTGGLNGCIANAGGGGMPMPYAELDTDEFMRGAQISMCWAPCLCVKHSLPLMQAAGGGSFIGMSSLAGHVTHPYFHAYCVGKAGIEEMMRNAADEYGRERNSVQRYTSRGFIATEIMEGIPRDSDVYHSYVEKHTHERGGPAGRCGGTGAFSHRQ